MIGSKTRLVAIIGSPVAQVKSPENFNRHFAEKGEDRAMIAIDILPESLADFVATARGWRNLDGFVVTIPHKTQIAGLLDGLTPTAQFLGAANVVRRDANGRLSGDMTDGDGFVEASRSHGFMPRGKSAMLVGAGAAGAAIGHALVTAGMARLNISDLDDHRAAALAAKLAAAFPHVAIAASSETPRQSFDLVVNASPCGMLVDDPSPIPGTILDRMAANGLVADVVTSAVETPLLVLARRRNLTIQTGEDMAKAQLFALGRAMGVINGAPQNV